MGAGTWFRMEAPANKQNSRDPATLAANLNVNLSPKGRSGLFKSSI